MKKSTIAVAAGVLMFSTLAGVQEMKKAEIDTVFEQGEVNPVWQIFYRTDLFEHVECKR